MTWALVKSDCSGSVLLVNMKGGSFPYIKCDKQLNLSVALIALATRTEAPEYMTSKGEAYINVSFLQEIAIPETFSGVITAAENAAKVLKTLKVEEELPVAAKKAAEKLDIFAKNVTFDTLIAVIDSLSEYAKVKPPKEFAEFKKSVNDSIDKLINCLSDIIRPIEYL